MSTTETALTTTGMLFVRGFPTATRARDGKFQLSIPCVAHYPGGIKTRWLITYGDTAAEAFWLAHKADITPAQPLRVVAVRLTIHNGEIAAQAQTITLAPKAAHCAQPLAA